MSVLGKKWLIKNHSKDKSVIEKILENRGLLEKEEGLVLHDPLLFSEMEKILSRIEEAIKDGDKIVIFGDYDVDGISGTAILVFILKKLGANVSYRLPHRLEDGYGLSEEFIDKFSKEGISLVITVDCGISCKSVVDHATTQNIDIIITDHHTIPEDLPEAYAILHPKNEKKYPYKELTGAGVALKLAHALIKKHFSDREDEILRNLIGLASLGTVADLGPLTGENKHIVRLGLQNLKKTTWLGLKKLLDLADVKEGDKIDSYTIGFRIAPRINAAGRIGDPYLALSLLLQEEESDRVHSLGQKLDELNKKRQEMTFEAVEEARAHFLKKGEPPYIFIAESSDWHVGIIGLVAGKLAEKYGRPAIILQDFGDTLVASARSPQYFNIIEAISTQKDLLISFGGHAQAAGFNIKKENYPKFKDEIRDYAENVLKNIDLKPILEIDCELVAEDISFDLLSEIEKLEPFGVANRKPTFLIKDIEPQFIGKVGKNKDHLKFAVPIGQNTVNVIAFQLGEYADQMRQHRNISMVCQLNRNTWKQKENLQLQALDFKWDEQ